MKRLFLFSVAVTLCCCLAAPSSVKASVFSDLLSFDGPRHTPGGDPFQGGGEDKLEDDSVSNFLDFGTPGFSVGDVIWGVVTLSDVQASGRPSVPVGPNGQVAIIFSAKIAGPGAGGSFSLVPIGDSTKSYDLRNLLDPSVQSGLNDNSLVTILSTTTPDTTPANDPLNWTTTQVSSATTGFSNTNNWFWELTADLLPGTDDFFEFVGSAALGGTDRGALTITSSAFGPSSIWELVDVYDYGAVTHLSNLTLDIGSVNIATSAQKANGWEFRDQSTFFVNPVPEPLSMLVWAGLAGVFGLVIARRRRSA